MAPPVKAAPAPAKKSKVKEILWVTFIIIATCGVAAYCASSDSGTVEPVDAATAETVVADPARASAAHGICYGWSLSDGAAKVSTGSNLGVGISIADRPAQCPKFIEVRGTYHWYPESSESTDYASYTINTTVTAANKIDPNAFDRLGAGTGALLGSPTTVILDAAEALPLLAQEVGAVSTPVPEPTLSGSAAPLETGGSDFLRDRWVLLVVTGILLLGALIALFFGIRSSRRIKRGEESDPFAKTPPAVPQMPPPPGQPRR